MKGLLDSARNDYEKNHSAGVVDIVEAVDVGLQHNFLVLEVEDQIGEASHQFFFDSLGRFNIDLGFIVQGNNYLVLVLDHLHRQVEFVQAIRQLDKVIGAVRAGGNVIFDIRNRNGSRLQQSPRELEEREFGDGDAEHEGGCL